MNRDAADLTIPRERPCASLFRWRLLSPGENILPLKCPARGRPERAVDTRRGRPCSDSAPTDRGVIRAVTIYARKHPQKRSAVRVLLEQFWERARWRESGEPATPELACNEIIKDLLADTSIRRLRERLNTIVCAKGGVDSAVLISTRCWRVTFRSSAITWARCPALEFLDHTMT